VHNIGSTAHFESLLWSRLQVFGCCCRDRFNG